ncbi:TPA: thioredoxin-disulfide reductase [Patescibacteria group bacterium]|nr:thioredoxin-disulfide reductase [Patescibacteria group bacterium]HCR42173.1 thioredoxin-disulfide reductase [Patescibacteria group bacterium]
MVYDLIIIGSGPAGLTAALYASRRFLKTLVIGQILGGQAILPSCVENYPGAGKTDGLTLAKAWQDQTISAGAEIKTGLVTDIKQAGDGFEVKLADGAEYQAKAVILTMGRNPRKLNVPGEVEFTGKGVAYCATCDAPLFAGKDVVVVGGGNAAIDAVILLANIAKKVYLVHRHDKFKAEAVLLHKLATLTNVEQVLYAQIKEIKGNNLVEQVKIEQIQDRTEKVLDVQGVFIEIGGDANTGLVKDFVNLNEKQEIIIDERNQTSVKGVFAAGDATTVLFKQIVVAAGEGAKAALSAYNYIQLKNNR